MEYLLDVLTYLPLETKLGISLQIFISFINRFARPITTHVDKIIYYISEREIPPRRVRELRILLLSLSLELY